MKPTIYWKVRKTDGRIVLITRGRVLATVSCVRDAETVLKGYTGDENATIRDCKTWRR